MNIFTRISVFSFVWTLAVTSSLPALDDARPNILFIMVDDLGKDWISCYGAEGIETPRIDQLAKSGMLFHNAWSMPQCTPTRVALLTGQYPWRTGWVNHWDVPRWGVAYFDWQRYQTCAGLLKSAGYRTAIAGKWQINDFRLEPKALEKHGFDDWLVWTGFEAGNRPSAERYMNAYVHTREGSSTRKGKFGPDLYCDFLIDFMKKHRDEPMFLYHPMALTHGPLVTTPLQQKPITATGRERARQRFAGMVRYVDHLVGRLLDTLEELQIRDRTIVIFTTDNGSPKKLVGRRKGLPPRGGKGTKWETGICQPFIVSCPGIVPEGAETWELTDFTDLLPTFADLGKAKLPKGLTIDGQSIAPLLTGKSKTSPRSWILSMGYGAAQLKADGVRGREPYTDRVLRDKRYKAWVGSDREIHALYDLQKDPGESENLVESDRGDVVDAMKRFRSILASMPQADARPQYRKRKANSWDRKPQ